MHYKDKKSKIANQEGEQIGLRSQEEYDLMQGITKNNNLYTPPDCLE